MTIKIISGILMLINVYFGISHGLQVFKKPTQQYIEMTNSLGMTRTIQIAIGIVSILSALLILLPGTFFIGNVARAMLLVFMMGLALKAGNYKFALIEIPFILLPLISIYLGHPFKNTTM